MTTMQDIAGKANVSRAAVSAVLNGNSQIRVSSKKREEILAIARQMNYRPNLLARSLVSRNTRTIGIYLCAPTDMFYAEMLTAFQRELKARNYAGHFVFWENLADVQYAYDMGRGQRVDGIITCHGDASMLPAGVPAVIFGTKQSEVDSFFFDWDEIYRRYMAYLTSLGHRKIAFLGDEKTRGYQAVAIKKAGEKSGISVMTVPCKSIRRMSLPAANELLSLPLSERPTAVVGCNDVAALTFINAALSRHIRVPEDISVIGFDNIEESLYSAVPLTTAGLDLKKVSEDLFDRLFARMAQPDMPVTATALVPELVERASCMPLYDD